MAVPKRRTSKARRDKRRSHHDALRASAQQLPALRRAEAAPSGVRELRHLSGPRSDPGRRGLAPRAGACSSPARDPRRWAWVATSTRRATPRVASSTTADAALGFSLSRLCFEGPEDQLVRTENQQPAILTTSIALLRALEERGRRSSPHFYVAGHSLGEYSALVAAGARRLR